MQGVTDDGCPLSFTAPDLGSRAIAAGVGFAGYSDGLPSTGYAGCGSGTYARKHSPWTDFPAVPASANLPFTAFPSSYSSLPGVSFVIPDLQHDMHDGTVAQGDAWLAQNLDAYITWAKTHNSLFVLTFDEDDNTDGNRIPTVMAGAHVVPGVYPETINHYSLLRTICDAVGIPAPGAGATTSPITDTWTPGGDPAFARDTFARTVTGGWGAADVGGTWSLSGSAADFAVRPGAATMRLGAPGRTDIASLPAARSADTDLTLTVGDDKVPTGGPVYLNVLGRHASVGDGYDARLVLTVGGGVNLSLVRVVGGVESAMTSESAVPGVSVGPGNPVALRLQVVGTAPTVLRVRAWRAAATEPTTWNVTATDPTAGLQAPGYVGLQSYLSSRSTNPPVTVSLSSFAAVVTGSISPPPPPTTIASDSFARSVTGGWGRADVGGAWSIPWLSSNAAVAGGHGTLRLPAGQTITASLPSATSASDDLVTSIALDRLPVGGPVYPAVAIRRVGSAEYALDLLLDPSGAVTISLVRTVNGSDTALTPPSRLSGVTLAAGRALSLRVQAVGTAPTTLRARAWISSTEPGGWNAAVTDAGAGLQSPGYPALSGYLSSRATNGPVTMAVGPLVVTAAP